MQANTAFATGGLQEDNSHPLPWHAQPESAQPAMSAESYLEQQYGDVQDDGILEDGTLRNNQQRTSLHGPLSDHLNPLAALDMQDSAEAASAAHAQDALRSALRAAAPSGHTGVRNSWQGSADPSLWTPQATHMSAGSRVQDPGYWMDASPAGGAGQAGYSIARPHDPPPRNPGGFHMSSVDMWQANPNTAPFARELAEQHAQDERDGLPPAPPAYLAPQASGSDPARLQLGQLADFSSEQDYLASAQARLARLQETLGFLESSRGQQDALMQHQNLHPYDFARSMGTLVAMREGARARESARRKAVQSMDEALTTARSWKNSKLGPNCLADPGHGQPASSSADECDRSTYFVDEICTVCWKEQSEIAYLPCRHLPICSGCQTILGACKPCVLCRKAVEEYKFIAPEQHASAGSASVPH